MSSFEPILLALHDAGAKAVVVGGLAVVLHGHARLTADLDLVIDFSPGEAVKVLSALERLGMIPRAPVRIRDFLDPECRRSWREEKNLQVFSLHDPRHPLVEVDLFVDPPIPYAELAGRSEPRAIGAAPLRIASMSDLIAMKRAAGRPKDLEDIAALEAISRRRNRR